MKALILAGGSGQRLWPVSGNSEPKQFLKLFGPNSKPLLVETIERALEIPGLSRKDIYITVHQGFRNKTIQLLVEYQYGDLLDHILTEPCKRNTAPAIALSVQYLLEAGIMDQSDVLVIMPSDHKIAESGVLASKINQAKSLAKGGFIITLGVSPAYPETGYGYITCGEHMNMGSEAVCYRVNGFTEKPSLEKAWEYTQRENCYWNTGIFVSAINTLLDAFSQYAPDIVNLLNEEKQGSLTSYERLPSISFDKAILEKVPNSVMIPLGTHWSDVGRWDSLYASLPKDSAENVLQSAALSIYLSQSRGCFIKQQTRRQIVLLGMENCFVVDTDENLLIGKMEFAQEVGAIAHQLQERPNIDSQWDWGFLKPMKMPCRSSQTAAFQLHLHADRKITIKYCDNIIVHLLDGQGALTRLQESQAISPPFIQIFSGEGELSFATTTSELSMLISGKEITLQEPLDLSNNRS